MSTVTNTNTTWVTPRTWTTGELVTKTIMDAHVRDQLNALKTPANAHSVIDEGVDYSTTSTSFINIDGTDLLHTITTAGGTLYATFTGNVYVVATATRAYFDIIIDGTTRIGGDDGLVVMEITTNPRLVCLMTQITGLSAASHTIAVQWKANAGTIGMYAGAGTASFDVHPRFITWEEV